MSVILTALPCFARNFFNNAATSKEASLTRRVSFFSSVARRLLAAVRAADSRFRLFSASLTSFLRLISARLMAKSDDILRFSHWHKKHRGGRILACHVFGERSGEKSANFQKVFFV